jgi:diacylglycerol O-acyltransferase
MRRLNPIDAMLVYQEILLNQYAHSMRVTLVDTARYPPDRAAPHVRDTLARIISRFALFSWRQVPTPFGLHHPLWVPDPDYKVDNHLYRIGCPSPGTERELAEVVATIASRRLDLSRPLWENWIVDGLASKQIAIVTKVHHAVADGVATAQIIEDFFSTEPVPDADLPLPHRAEAAPIPGKPRLLLLAAKDVATVLPTIPAIWRKSLEVRKARKRRPAELTPARGHSSQPSMFNCDLGRYRRFAHASFPMSDVKSVKNDFGVSINDLYLAVCAGAMRHFLQQRGQPLDVPLIAGVPTSIRTSEEVNTYGNRFKAMTVRLPVHVAGPVERLMAAKADADIAKADVRLEEGGGAQDILAVLPPVIQKTMLRATKRMLRQGRPLIGNIAVSNISGPRVPLYIGEMKVDAFYGVGPLIPGIALNITAWSYVDDLHVSILSDAAVIGDLWPLADLLRDSFDELRKEAPHRQGGDLNV